MLWYDQKVDWEDLKDTGTDFNWYLLELKRSLLIKENKIFYNKTMISQEIRNGCELENGSVAFERPFSKNISTL